MRLRLGQISVAPTLPRPCCDCSDYFDVATTADTQMVLKMLPLSRQPCFHPVVVKDKTFEIRPQTKPVCLCCGQLTFSFHAHSPIPRNVIPKNCKRKGGDQGKCWGKHHGFTHENKLSFLFWFFMTRFLCVTLVVLELAL